MPLPPHGLRSVEHKIDQYLLQAFSVAGDIGGGVVKVQHQLHVGEIVLHELGGAPHRIVYIQGDEGSAKGPRVIQKLRDDPIEAIHFVDDDLHQLFIFALELPGVELLSGTFDGGEGVANLMGKAG